MCFGLRLGVLGWRVQAGRHQCVILRVLERYHSQRRFLRAAQVSPLHHSTLTESPDCSDCSLNTIAIEVLSVAILVFNSVCLLVALGRTVLCALIMVQHRNRRLSACSALIAGFRASPHRALPVVALHSTAKIIFAARKFSDFTLGNDDVMTITWAFIMPLNVAALVVLLEPTVRALYYPHIPLFAH